MTMAAHARAMLALIAALAAPCVASAQGTAPAQGVTQPLPQPAPETPPPAPKPNELSDGRPRQDPGGGSTNTSADTTAKTPLPQQGQANPGGMR
jgi:hypothetical protein